MQRRKFTREFKLEAMRLIRDRGVSVAQASVDLDVHQSQLRDWVKKFAEDPQYAFPGNGQMKPEQLEIARLKREVIKLKGRAGHSKKSRGLLREGDENCLAIRMLAPSYRCSAKENRRATGAQVFGNERSYRWSDKPSDQLVLRNLAVC
jgi:transposase